MLDASPRGPAESELRESREWYHAGAKAPARYWSLGALALSAGTGSLAGSAAGVALALFGLSSAGLAGLSLATFAVATLALPRGAGTDASRNLLGFCATPRKRTSKCRCGPVERPVEPTSPILRPRATTSPSFTRSFD